MSAQTGVASSSGPVSKRFVDRARYQVDRFKNEPNPIWIRELKQAARLARTPIVLAVVSILMTLLIASIGGILATTGTAPSSTGVALFQVFFSLAFFVVVLVGPAVAANSIASEREGRTWEAVVLTGMRPGEVARGKFFAAYTAIGMYIVMLAPVGALPFLFGGVTATEVVVAFLFLFLIALLSVAFGLAISSKMSSLRTAIVVTLLLAFPMAVMSFVSFGVLLSAGAHKQWPGVVEWVPIWLPSAYERAPFGLDYVIFLFVIPVAAVVLPAWFLYEVTIANLTSITDDRSTGLKRWLLVAAPIVTVAAALPMVAVDPADHADLFVIGMSAMVIFLSFCVFLFQGDPVGPSRRVKAQWDRARAGRFLRFLGPGVVRASVLLLVLSLGAYAAFTVFGVGLIAMSGHFKSTKQIEEVAAFAQYAAAFTVFVVGLAAFVRARTSSALAARIVTFAILFAISVGPWVIAAIAGAVGSRGATSTEDALMLASPSPFYVFVMIEAISKGKSAATVTLGVAFAGVWAVLGLVLLAGARSRCAEIIRRHDATLAEAERLLAAEDAAAAGTPAPAAPPAAEAPAT